MATVELILWTILILLLIIVLSSLPLYFAVELVGGRTTIFKTFLVMVAVAILSVILQAIFPVWGVIIGWILLLLIFKAVFHIGWIRAIAVWVLWIVFVILFVWLFSILGVDYNAIAILN